MSGPAGISRPFRLALIALLPAVAAGACLAGSREAGAAQAFNSRIVLSFDPRDSGDYFEGRVFSGNPTCVGGRTVVIRRGRQKLGVVRTNRRGGFELRSPGRSGLYRAVARRRVVRGIVCRRAVDYHREVHSG